MPTYEYECTRCGATFDLFQSITAKPKTRVPTAEKACKCDAPVRRLIGGGAGLLFKGSGFYQTDYRSEGYKKAAKAETSASGDGTKGKSDAGKSETGKAAGGKSDSGNATTGSTGGGKPVPSS